MAVASFDARETAAQTHAVLRARSGYDIQQLASEYRALRSSLLQSWFDACGAEEPPLGDVIRFNEAIDQALAESIAFFSAYVERSRNRLLGILGHDMRTPLQSIKMTALLLSELNAGADVSKAASRLINSGARMQLLLDDLLDFNRVQLGLGLAVAPVPVNLVRICADEVEEIQAAHPDRAIELQVVGDCHGCWDPSRMHQLLANLVGNAVKYGSSATPIRVSLVGEDEEVHLRVRNSGPPVEQLATMFEPLVRGSPARHGDDTSLGLGLYIAREIARGHGGEIEGHSDEFGTVFSVRLPRQNFRAAGTTPEASAAAVAHCASAALP
jgi:signal transduction histidine kinase